MSGLASSAPSPRPMLRRSKRFDPKDLLSLGSDSKKPVNKFQEPKQTKITQFLRKSMKGAPDVHELRADKTCTKKDENVIPESELSRMNGKGKSIANPIATHCTCKLCRNFLNSR